MMSGRLGKVGDCGIKGRAERGKPGIYDRCLLAKIPLRVRAFYYTGPGECRLLPLEEFLSLSSLSLLPITSAFAASTRDGVPEAEGVGDVSCMACAISAERLAFNANN